MVTGGAGDPGLEDVGRHKQGQQLAIKAERSRISMG